MEKKKKKKKNLLANIILSQENQWRNLKVVSYKQPLQGGNK